MSLAEKILTLSSHPSGVVQCVQPMSLMTKMAERLARAKAAYSTRRIPRDKAVKLSTTQTPRAGDLVLARVDKLGQHSRLELADGRRARLYVGDEVVVCYGNRYAPDQFEAVVPENLGNCDLVAAGGIAAQTLSRHSRMKRPTCLEPLGLLADTAGRPLNLADWALPAPPPQGQRPYTIAVAGTSMNAGKTTTAAALIRGFRERGQRVGAAKVTGTGAGCDRWSMLDAGALQVLDFTDAGFASTYRLGLPQLEMILHTLTGWLHRDGAEIIVLEVADGLFQRETKALLASAVFAASVDGLVFAAGDAMGALAGADWLRRHELPVLAISGLLTASPLAIQEASEASGIPVIGVDELGNGAWCPERSLKVSQSDALQAAGEIPAVAFSPALKPTARLAFTA